MELPLGYWAAHHGDDNLVYGLIDLVEESMEMVGVMLFLFCLTDHLAGESGVLQISFTATAQVERQPLSSRPRAVRSRKAS